MKNDLRRRFLDHAEKVRRRDRPDKCCPAQPRAFTAPAEGFFLQLGTGSKNYNDGATGMRKRFDDIFSCLYTIHERDGQTDRRTNGRTQADSKDRPFA